MSEHTEPEPTEPTPTEPKHRDPDPATPEPTNISDKLKQTIDELDIDRHVNDLVIGLEGLFTSARDTVATLAAERGGDVERLLDKVSTTIDERTDGRYAGELGRIRTTVTGGVARLAEHRPAEPPQAADPRAAEPRAAEPSTRETSVWPVDEIEPPHAE